MILNVFSPPKHGEKIGDFDSNYSYLRRKGMYVS
jgi:hypothetical protein